MPATGRALALARTGADVVSRPSVDDDHVYFVSLDNVLRALNRGNGVQQWKRGLPFRPAWRPMTAADTVLVTGIRDRSWRSIGRMERRAASWRPART